jgi:hypothetical protein
VVAARLQEGAVQGENDETDAYDQIAICYLSYALFPLVVVRAGYGLLYETYTGWYFFRA